MTKQSVAIPPIRTSKPAHCVSPRPHTDESLRRHHYGQVQPMPEERSDRFHWTMRALFVAIALAGIVFQYNGGF